MMFVTVIIVGSVVSKQDVLLEDPLHTAIFVSLSGTRCLLANQWNCTLKENSHKMAMTLRGGTPF